MKAILVSILLSLAALPVAAQHPAESVWTFGGQAVVDFSTLSPVVTNLPNNGGAPLYAYYRWSATVCDNSGQILFWAKMANSIYSTFNVFDRNGQTMPNGNLNTSGVGEFVPVVVPVPGSAGKYYLFYIRNHGLTYSVIDMSLNGGLGDVVASQKNILLGSYGTVLDQKVLAVPGCNGAWIIVRSNFQNQYLSYAITAAGINPVPAVSNVGNLPLSYYGSASQPSGVIKASLDGKRMAAACGLGNVYVPGTVFGGLEIYDVESCSGKLLNPMVIDTGMFYGVCFSPDGTKLYATKSYQQTVYQYDVMLATPAAITASRTAILSNPNYGNFYPDEYMLGELKRGRDGKIYVPNHVCGGLPGTSAMHVINNPNAAGLACNPVINAVPLGYACPGLKLPADIIQPQVQDTVYGQRKDTVVCFRDSAIIRAPAGYFCYRWAGDTTSGRSRIVAAAGSYISLYHDGACTLHIDTIAVTFTKLGHTTGGSYSCPGTRKGSAWIVPQMGDTTSFIYQWTNSAGAVLQTHTGSTGDSLRQIDTGTYYIRLTTPSGCDTVLKAIVRPYPIPNASFVGDTVVCKDVAAHFHNTSTAPSWTWYFDVLTTASDSSLSRVYHVAGDYPVVLVVKNVEGCTDTARKNISVKELDLRLETSSASVHLSEEVTLSSSAAASYSVLLWKPDAIFGSSTSYTQRVRAIATSTYTVIGQSQYGCIDSASIVVGVEPVVFLPNAFTPDGDGLNDKFRPRTAGDNILFRRFEVYNRWGQLVWSAYGSAAAEGWDGTSGGRPADFGTYFYSIDIETPSGETISRKGDVILIR